VGKDDVVVVVFSIIGPNRRKTFCAPENDVEKTIVIIVVRIVELQARRRNSATNARLFGRIDIERGTGEDATERARERASSSRKWEERGEDDEDEKEDDEEEEEERDEKQSVDSGRGRCGRDPGRDAADIWSAFGRRGTDGGA